MCLYVYTKAVRVLVILMDKQKSFCSVSGQPGRVAWKNSRLNAEKPLITDATNEH